MKRLILDRIGRRLATSRATAASARLRFERLEERSLLSGPAVAAGGDSSVLSQVAEAVVQRDDAPQSIQPGSTQWNPDDAEFNIQLSNDNLTVETFGHSDNDAVRGTIWKRTGRWYFEVSIEQRSPTSFYNAIGVSTRRLSLEGAPGWDDIGCGYQASGSVNCSNARISTSYELFEAGDMIGVAVDLAAGQAFYRKNGVWQGGADPARGIGGVPLDANQSDGVASPMFPAINLSTGDRFTANFGQSTFVNQRPAGFRPGWFRSGGGGRVFAQLNPFDRQQNIVLSNHNLTAETRFASEIDSVRATTGRSAGDWYFEVTVNARSAGTESVIGTATANLNLEASAGLSGFGCGYRSTGLVACQRRLIDGSFDSFGIDDVIGVAVDLDAGVMYFSKNGVWQNGADPATGVSGLKIGSDPHSPNLFPAVTISTGDRLTANFGGSAFQYQVPAGFRPGW